MKDDRVHCVLWMMGGAGSPLVKKSEFSLIKKHLQPVCNVIPVVSMADRFSQKELADYK